MNKLAWAGGGLAVILLGLVVFLAQRNGKLKGQLDDQDAIIAAITQQRDEAMQSSMTNAKEARAQARVAREALLEGAREAAARAVSEEALAASQAINAALQKPTDFASCMANLEKWKTHARIQADVLAGISKELRWNKEAAEGFEAANIRLEAALADAYEAVRLEGARIEAMNAVHKKKRKMNIAVGVLVGVLAAGASFGGGYALAVAQ